LEVLIKQVGLLQTNYVALSVKSASMEAEKEVSDAVAKEAERKLKGLELELTEAEAQALSLKEAMEKAKKFEDEHVAMEEALSVSKGDVMRLDEALSSTENRLETERKKFQAAEKAWSERTSILMPNPNPNPNWRRGVRGRVY